MTGAFWRSVFAVALFALHPLRVESVAWAAERKDVLSSFFLMITIWAYIRYVEHPAIKKYIIVILFFIMGLMSKPMVVTLPFVLILLDYWPLGRLGAGIPESVSIGRRDERKFEPKGASIYYLIIEKAPLFILTLALCITTIIINKSSGAIVSFESIPLKFRIANTFISYVNYIWKMVWPRNLSVFYPHAINTIPMWTIAGSALLLLCISLFSISKMRSHPYVIVGWLWYVGTLIPVIGLIQSGTQAMADRFTYIPMIGLYVIVSWGIYDLLRKWQYHKILLSISGSVVILAIMICTWFQASYWQNSIILFRHAIDVTQNNARAHHLIGNVLTQKGKLINAISHFSEALKIMPDNLKIHNDMAVALGKQSRYDKALAHLAEALRINPDYAEAYYNFGVLLARQKKYEEAIKYYTKAVNLKPDYKEARHNLRATLRKAKNNIWKK